MINLVRLGHYFTPSGSVDSEARVQGTCRTALVVDSATAHPRSRIRQTGEEVGVVYWDYNGQQNHRDYVLVSEPITSEDTFHLSAECPFKR